MPGSNEDAIKQIILCKTTIAYGIAALLRQAAESPRDSAITPASLDGQCSIDNFVVRTKAPCQRSRPTWRDIEGVDMLSPRLSVNIVEPFFLQELDGDDQDDKEGAFLEAEFPYLPETDGGAIIVIQSEEDDRCHLFGVLLYELFFNCSPISVRGDSVDDGGSEAASNSVDSSLEQRRKKIQMVGLRTAGNTEISNAARVRHEKTYPALIRGERADLSGGGLPSSLSTMIHHLLDCGDDVRPENSYESLEAVINDLHLLLLDPSRFLFNHEPSCDNNGKIRLSFREHHLYGRENEVAVITEAFCRVSNGKRESLFIGGFSGSGKSRLVNGLTARIDAVGGYLLTHKFDQMSQERSILDVVAMFNYLCLLIKEKSSQRDLMALVDDLVQVFGSDWSTLARLLPNINTIVPQLEQLADSRGEVGNQTNVRSICFTLQRFIRVVSSAANPVTLFLDDLQWCDKSVFTVVESLLCDTIGPSCLFFVGTYRSNEVADDDEILCLAQRLKSFGVPTIMLSLEGLNPSDLNTMVSDALCVFPRLTEPLSNIIYQKTKGNPFFVIAFMRSLVDRGLLEYSFDARRWVWNHDDIRSMDITSNVLHLLSSKMNGLSTSIQSALKVAACFGIKIEESLVKTLSSDPEHSDICDNLNQVVMEGLMIKGSSSEYQFVHDKIREAAYGLIPEKDRAQYHYSLGMTLYSITKGKVSEDMLFSIADQIKHGIGNLGAESPELRLDFAKLFELSSSKAVACSDHAASCSYLEHALSLLPTGHWKSHYELSLRLSLLLTESCYSCGDVEKAQSILQDMTPQCRSIEEKLYAHVLFAKILIDRKYLTEAYALCCEVLSQLGEEIPEPFHPTHLTEELVATLELVKNVSCEDLMKMTKMDERLNLFMHFYTIMGTAAFFIKPTSSFFIVCKMVQLTMRNGLCEYSILGFVHLSAVLTSSHFSNIVRHDIASASRIGRAAMSCWKTRYHSSMQLPKLYSAYYGFIAHYTEPLQTCADMLRQGFDIGMSLGQTGVAFENSSLHISTALIAGERLPTLLERVDYYLDLTNTYKNENSKEHLSIFRETISILIDKGGSTSLSRYAIDVSSNMATTKVLEMMYFQLVIQTFWQGHNERCQYYIEKLIYRVTSDNWRLQFFTFFRGMNSYQLMRTNPTIKLRKTAKKCIKLIETAASHSSWNFLNKAHLLHAEEFSHAGNHDKAMESYLAAICSAISSGFIHEQGLACELAGYHCKNIGDRSRAWNFFNQAKCCYTEWGSQMKVESVARYLDSLSDYPTTRASPSLNSRGNCAHG
ncbi:hypothetical protein ACHAXA_011785 [Cyclostephanos tholiformis]|uniref:Orc1-like AAA ATPase domain-containing protein n=1 Tax=Cyclostephanos tholiformis TaxID=382380 RepID=A0ABD3RD18_9STRA